jgi:hypothetical protein
MDDINWFVDSMSPGLLALFMWPMLSKVYFSCHFMWSSLICLYSDVLVLTVADFVITWGLVFLRCLSVCYIICDYHWFWFSIYSCGWLTCQCFKLLVSDFSWCQVTDADFIIPTLLCLLPFGRLVIFVSTPLHDGCINWRLCTSSSFALTCVDC